MRELHILLFYLRRNYTGILDLDPEIVFNDLVEKGLVRDTEKKEFKNFKEGFFEIKIYLWFLGERNLITNHKQATQPS